MFSGVNCTFRLHINKLARLCPDLLLTPERLRDVHLTVNSFIRQIADADIEVFMFGIVLHRRLYAMMLVLAGLILGSIFIVFSSQASAGSENTPRVVLVAPKNVQVGEPATIKLLVLDARNTAGFQTTINFDQAAITLDSAILGQGLAASGRAMLPLGPITREGAVSLGAATCPTSKCASTQYKSAGRQRNGVNGRIELAELVVTATQAGQYNLTLSNVQLVDPEGMPLTIVSTDTVLNVVAK